MSIKWYQNHTEQLIRENQILKHKLKLSQDALLAVLSDICEFSLEYHIITETPTDLNTKSAQLHLNEILTTWKSKLHELESIKLQVFSLEEQRNALQKKIDHLQSQKTAEVISAFKQIIQVPASHQISLREIAEEVKSQINSKNIYIQAYQQKITQQQEQIDKLTQNQQSYIQKIENLRSIIRTLEYSIAEKDILFEKMEKIRRAEGTAFMNDLQSLYEENLQLKQLIQRKTDTIIKLKKKTEKFEDFQEQRRLLNVLNYTNLSKIEEGEIKIQETVNEHIWQIKGQKFSKFYAQPQFEEQTKNSTFHNKTDDHIFQY